MENQNKVRKRGGKKTMKEGNSEIGRKEGEEGKQGRRGQNEGRNKNRKINEERNGSGKDKRR
jgi:hypothetical protein